MWTLNVLNQLLKAIGSVSGMVAFKSHFDIKRRDSVLSR